MNRHLHSIIPTFLILCLFLISCKDKPRSAAEAIIKKWAGKEIVFPDNFQAQYLGKDTTFNEVFDKEYKIMLYVDSIGCTSCRLGLFNWYHRIMEADTLAPGKVGFIFFMQPKEKEQKELAYLTRRDNFRYPVFVDLKNEIGHLNNFESDSRYQCFLLDHDNKVIVVGNPKDNPLIWELYKEVITGKKAQLPQDKTTVEIYRKDIEVAGMKLDQTSEVSFNMTNTGDKPLVVYHIESSCGCTVPQWDKSPVMPGRSLNVKVLVTPDAKGFFNKSIDIYTNTAQQHLKCNIYGTVE